MSFVRKALDEIGEIVAKKNQDYAGAAGEFWNFEYAASVAGGCTTPESVIRSQIGIKLGRLQNLIANPGENYESIKDTVLDLHGYAAILHGYYLSREQQAVNPWEVA